MRWLEKMSDNIRRGVRSWLQIQPANSYNIQIREMMDFETNAIRNRIWYRGDGNELEQLYGSLTEYADKYKFWASKSTPGMDMRKIHTGLPQLIVKVLTAIVLSDMNDFEFDSDKQEETWKSIEEQNHFREENGKGIKRNPVHWRWGLQSDHRHCSKRISHSGMVSRRTDRDHISARPGV